MAIFTPLRCSGACLDARGHGLEVEQRATATRARDVIGLEAAATCCLQNVVSQPQRHARTSFAAHENRVADAIRQQCADDNRGAKQSDLRFESRGFKRQTILEQNRIGATQPLQLGRQQTERGDGGQIYAVLHCDKLRVAVDLEVLRRIKFGDVRVFIDRLGLHIILWTNLRRNLVKRGASDDDPDELFAAAF